MGKRKDITDEKIIAFKAEADKLLKQNYRNNVYLNKHQIAYQIATGPAPRFYTSVGTAMRRINELASGNLTISNPYQVEMFKEINRRYQAKLKEYAGRKYRTDIMYEVISSPAPSFYISPISGYDLLYKNEE